MSILNSKKLVLDSALTVNPGVEQPPMVDDASLQRFLNRRMRKDFTAAEHV